MKYPKDFVNKIICGNCVEIMREIPDESIDLAVTSPPYDALRDYKGYTFNFEAIANQLYRITKIGGIVVWVVGDATIKGSETGTSFKQALYFKEIGFNLHDTMIYKKANPPPLEQNRYQPTFEFMFVFSKGKPKTFNPIMIPCKFIGAKRNRATDKKTLLDSKMPNPRNEITVTRPKKYSPNVWDLIVGRDGDTGNHPAPFPKKLAEDHILSWSNEGDIVLDPMCGSGTTCKMAKLNNRKFIGIDISEEYCKIAEKRLQNEKYLWD